MFTKCQNCGKELTIHIFSSVGELEEETLYCSQCSSYQEGREAYDPEADLSCSVCGRHYKDFIEEGYLSCASCYSSFASLLERLMEKYHNVTPGKKTFTQSYEASSIALARSEELCDYVLSHAVGFAPETQIEEEKREGKKMAFVSRSPSLSDPNGDEKNIIESARLRAARNVEGLPYLNHLSKEQKKELRHALLSPKGALSLYLLRDTSPDLRPTALDTGDEDHLRISWTFVWPGKEACMERLLACLKQLELLDKLYQWQFHPDYGFLTACPALAGEALRLSFQLRLPALLSEPKLWQLWRKNLAQAGYEIRYPDGIDGKEGNSPRSPSEAQGKGPKEGRIQVSNRHWAWGGSLTEKIRRFFLFLEPLVEAEYKAKI